MPLPPVYTKRLSQLSNVGGTAVSDPVPPGKVWVVRCMTAASYQPGELHFLVQDEHVTVWVDLLGGLVPNFSSLWNGRWVLNEGARIFFVVMNLPLFSYTADFTASGYELTAEAA